MTTSFITTAIPYVNARPHLGFAYELVLGDVLARHRRRRGRDVRFVNGTDENSLKNVAAATREGVPVRALVERNATAFRQLGALLDISPDDFVRTSDDIRHAPAVAALWRGCARDLYRKPWRGYYCVGCEAFVDSPEPCGEHAAPPELVEEDNWFFALSRWREPVRDAIASGRLAIVPEAARAEVLAFLDGPVHDLSVSRAASRAAGWGIPVPGDPDQVVYVWFDALASYLTSLGLGDDGAGLARYWDAGERLHVIGKGIARFHAVYWPAFLLSAGLPLPDRILVHGYLTVDGVKISKDRETAPVPPLVDRLGADAVRWYFVRRCRTRADGDVELDTIAALHDGELVGRAANLVHRAVTLAVRGGVAPRGEHAGDDVLRALAEALPARVDAALDAFLPDDATAAILELVDAANRALQDRAPWRLAPGDAAIALAGPLGAARVACGELAPFVPGVARALEDRLSEPLRVGPPPLVRCADRNRQVATPG